MGVTYQDGESLEKKETILVVDDEAIIANTTQAILDVLGYRTLMARSGEEALSIFSENGKAIDLVILDMVMPGLGGAEVFDLLRDIDSKIRVILSSGHPLNDDIQKLLDRGRCGFIQKPFDLAELSARIREMIGSRPSA